MSPSHARAVLVVAVALEAVAMLFARFLGEQGALPSRVVLTLLAAFVPYLAVVYASSTRELGARWALTTTAALGAVLVFAPPVLSDDLYRYLWEGRLWLEGQNPYRLPPDDPTLAPLRDALWEPINNKPLASIYPPLMQVLFVLSALLGGRVWTLKLLALSGLLLTVAVVARVSKRPGAALALGINPLALSETALNGHFDFLVGGTLLLAAWQIGRRALKSAALTTCIAVGLKVVGVVLLPLFWRTKRALAIAVFGSALLLLPMVLARTPDDPTSGPGQFAARWQGNDSVHAVVHWLSGQLFDPPTAALVSRSVAAIGLLLIVGLVLRRGRPPVEAARTLVWASLLLSPQVHPWYLGWLVPLDLACGGRAAVAWSALVFAAYEPLDRWVVDGTWEMPVWLQFGEYLLLAAAIGVDRRRARLGLVLEKPNSDVNSVD